MLRMGSRAGLVANLEQASPPWLANIPYEAAVVADQKMFVPPIFPNGPDACGNQVVRRTLLNHLDDFVSDIMNVSGTSHGQLDR